MKRPSPAALAAHAKRLRALGVDPDAKPRRRYRPPRDDLKDGMRAVAATSDAIPGNGSARESRRYTGDELLGIGTMHKSNSVPVRRDSDEARNIASMRRGA